MSSLPVPADGLSRYMSEVRRFPLLSAEEEQRLGRIVHDGLDEHGIAVDDHVRREAASRLVTANLRFVVKIAHEYRHYGLSLIDLIQEGNLGLMRAVSKFNPHRGFRLISYAVWWIRATIQAFILRSWSLVKIGTTQAQRKLFYKLRATKRELTVDGEAPTTAELASALSVTEEEIDEMDARLAARDFFLDAQIDGDGGATTYLEMLPSADPTQEESLGEAEEGESLKSIAAEAMKGLTEKERFVLERRVMADEPMTLQEIGDRFSISRERARQIEANAMKKMRRALAEHRPALAAVAAAG